MNNGFLIDTNIISMFSPDRKLPASDAARQWLRQQGEADALFVSAITVAEIERGLRALHRRGGTDRALRLNAWLEVIVETFGDNILPLDAVVARHLGRLEEAAVARGLHPGLGDLMIAATAEAYGLVVVTRNLRHFTPLGVACDLPQALADALA